jgi:urocanate hydratase
MSETARDRDEAVSIGVHINAVDLLQYLVDNNIVPHFLTSQSAIHEVLQTNTGSKNTYPNFGYCPQGWTPEKALDKRNNSPKEYVEKALESVARQARLMNQLQKRGAVTTDYGNYLVGTAMRAGYEEAREIGGFVPMFIRPLFCEGRGPFRWEVLSNDPNDLRVTDKYAKMLLDKDLVTSTWLDLASKYIPIEPGLPARVMWAGYGGKENPGRAATAMLLNQLVADKHVKAPIIIGRDQLDCGSVASPQRETRAMRDGSDPISCYVLHNFTSAVMNGAISVAMHDGGGVGVGNSLATNYIALADGTPEAQRKLFFLLTTDALTGIMRHYIAGEPKAIEMVEQNKLFIPGKRFHFDYEGLYQRTRQMIKEKTEIDTFDVPLF